MPSNKFLDIAKDVTQKNPQLFETLMDFEKTKEIRTKTRLNFTIDKNIASRFKKFCREKSYNMSSKIEQAMKDMMGDK